MIKTNKYYMSYMRTNEATITFVDKKYGYYGGNCHDRYQHTVTPSTRITKGSQLSCLLWPTSPDVGYLKYSKTSKVKNVICK